MPRTARLDAPGLVQHATVRGIERREIFRDDEDRENFVARLERLLPETSTACFAWALMPNHVHLLVRTGGVSLSTLMARLGTGYARYFNTRHDRSGHLFQNRFHSSVVLDEAHLRNAVRYIHLNPVRAGLVGDLESLEHHPWTGFSALCGRHPRAFQAVGVVLGWFASDPRAAREALRAWMAEPPEPLEPRDLRGVPDAGDGRGVGSAARGQTDRSPPGWDLDRLIAWSCSITGAEEPEVRSGYRSLTAVEARAIIAHFAAHALRLPARLVAPALGLSESGLSRARRRGSRLASTDGLSLPDHWTSMKSRRQERPRS